MANFEGEAGLDDPRKHRGLQFQVFSAGATAATCFNCNCRFDCQDIVELAAAFCRQSSAVFYSYTSSANSRKLKFDSVVMNWFTGRGVNQTRASRRNLQSYEKKRSLITEAGRRVRFDYQSIVAKLAQLKVLRSKAPEFPVV